MTYIDEMKAFKARLQKIVNDAAIIRAKQNAIPPKHVEPYYNFRHEAYREAIEQGNAFSWMPITLPTKVNMPLHPAYTRSCVWVDCSSTRKSITKPKQKVRYVPVRLKPRKKLTDDQVEAKLTYYDHLGYEDIPQWLQAELSVRHNSLVPETRTASEREQWDTVADAYEHRVTNKEMTTKDYIRKYNINKETIT
jgi:hypothetical protein